MTWEHALVIINSIIFLVLIANFINDLKQARSHIPQLCIELSTSRSCILLPVMQLPLCPSQCQIQLPSTIANLIITGSC